MLALFSMISSCVAPIVGVVLGAVAHRSILITGQRGWNLATAGIVIGWVGTFLGLLLPVVIALIAVVVNPNMR